MRPFALDALALSLVLVASGGLNPPIARAGSDAIAVTTTEDELNADGDCSLREAVMAINTEAPVDGCPGAPGSRNILLEPGEYLLTIPGAGEDAGLTGDLDALRPIQIELTRAGQATIDGGGLDRVIDVHPSAVGHRTVLTSLVLRNGDAGSEDGGAIRISELVCDGSPGSRRGIEVFGVVIDGNRAARGGGMHIGGCNGVVIIGTSIVRNMATDVGGGVSMDGSSDMDIETSTISTNQAASAGGGVWADLTGEFAGLSLSLVTVTENSAPSGGGFWSAGPTQLNAPIVANNVGGNCGGPGGPFSWAVSDDDTCGGPGVDDAGLLPLATVNGFPVHLLAPGSPAIEAAGEPLPNGWCSGNVRYDQVGNDRPLDGDGDGVAACDAGAIEAPAMPFRPSPSPSAAPLPDTAMLATPTRSVTWILVVTAGVAIAAASAARGRSRRPGD